MSSELSTNWLKKTGTRTIIFQSRARLVANDPRDDVARTSSEPLTTRPRLAPASWTDCTPSKYHRPAISESTAA